MEIQNTGTKGNKVEQGTETKKAQKVSVTYTLRSLKENINKLEMLGLATGSELETLREIHKNAVNKYVETM